MGERIAKKNRTAMWIIIASLVAVVAVTAGILIWYFTKGKTVEPVKTLESIEVVTPPNRSGFIEGEYWDFLGLSIKANYSDAGSEIVNDWDWNNKSLLELKDTNIIISYTLGDITKTVTLDITVSGQPEFDPVLENAKKIFKELPEIVTEDNLDYVKYCLDIYDGLTDGQKEKLPYEKDLFDSLREQVEQLEKEIGNRPPPPPEVYNISYAVFDGFPFTDIDYNNLTEYTEGGEAIILNSPLSETALLQGYEFAYWTDGYGNAVDRIINLKSDMTYYAVYELTETVLLKVIDYDDVETVYINSEINRGGDISVLNLEMPDDLLSLAFYLNDIRILDFSTLEGAEIILRAKVRAYRDVEVLTEINDVISNWEFVYTDDSGIEILIESGLLVSKNYSVPVGAVLTITAGLNVNKIFIDGAERGTRNGTIQASANFEVIGGFEPVKVTFERVEAEIIVITFIGITEISSSYPGNWDGVLSDYDITYIGAAFGEDNNQYINFYQINDEELLFDELINYEFKSDTVVIVTRRINRFSITINYIGGSVIIGGLAGRQTLEEALIGKTGENIEKFNYILDNSELTGTTKQELLNTFLMENIIVSSPFEGFKEPTPDDLYGKVNYTGQQMVGAWSALFSREDGMYESLLTLNANGTLEYINKFNGSIVSQFSAIYRMENGVAVIKELTLENSEYKTLIGRNEFIIDLSFVSDGLVAATFFEIIGTRVIKLNITLTKGAVRPINYTGREFTGNYVQTTAQGNTTQILQITLVENGTAIITAREFISGKQVGEFVNSGYYRIVDNKIYLYANGIVETGNIDDIIASAVKE